MAYRRSNRVPMNSDDKLAIGCVFAFFAMLAVSIAAYGNHLFWVFATLMSDAGITFGQGILILFGTIIFPFGIFHGFYLWFV